MAIETLIENAENAEELAEGEALETDQEAGEVTTVEDWQKSDEDIAAEEAALENPDEPGEVAEENPKPEKTLKAKKKLQRKLKESDEEKEALKAKIAELEGAKASAPVSSLSGKPKRPKELDYDSDEEYEAALEKYDVDIVDYRISERSTKKKETKAQEAKTAEIAEGVEAHFERAEELVVSSGIAPEKYNASNVTVRTAIDAIAPGKGDYVADYLITQLGAGSEKVFYHLGVNKVACAELVGLLKQDPSGMKAAIFLGQKKEQLTNPRKPKTNARQPASSIKGDANGGKAGGALKRAYDKADKSGNGQEMYNAKKAAKKAGVDVSKW